MDDVKAAEPQKDEDLCEQHDAWERRCWEAEQQLAEAEAEIERLRPLATIGELVRGMSLGTQLRRDYAALGGMAAWIAMQRQLEGPWRDVDVSLCHPSEVLRSIQEPTPQDQVDGSRETTADQEEA